MIYLVGVQLARWCNPCLHSTPSYCVFLLLHAFFYFGVEEEPVPQQMRRSLPTSSSSCMLSGVVALVGSHQSWRPIAAVGGTAAAWWLSEGMAASAWPQHTATKRGHCPSHLPTWVLSKEMAVHHDSSPLRTTMGGAAYHGPALSLWRHFFIDHWPGPPPPSSTKHHLLASPQQAAAPGGVVKPPLTPTGSVKIWCGDSTLLLQGGESLCPNKAPPSQPQPPICDARLGVMGGEHSTLL